MCYNGSTVKKYVFYYNPGLLKYTFTHPHPYQSARLKRAIEILESWRAVEIRDPGVGNDREVLDIHSVPYVKALKEASDNPHDCSRKILAEFGLTSDTPPYEGIFEAARDVVHASRMAASAINDGYELAFNMSGGLHHAQIDRASGFCAVSDIAAAIEILKRKHKYIAYVDIDLHHGDGPEKIYENDPDVLTVSIHQYGNGFYPGTGWVESSSANTSIINIPMIPDTSSPVWLRAVQEIIIPSLREFDPQVIVLQLGADAHRGDPLGSLLVNTPDWLTAVRMISDLGKPILALGGGGYDLENTAQMWAGAVVELIGSGVPVDKLDDKMKYMYFKDNWEEQFLDMDYGRFEYEGVKNFLDPIVANLGREEVDDYS